MRTTSVSLSVAVSMVMDRTLMARQSVDHGIFHQGLEDQAGYPERRDLDCVRERDLQPVREAPHLQLKVKARDCSSSARRENSRFPAASASVAQRSLSASWIAIDCASAGSHAIWA